MPEANQPTDETQEGLLQEYKRRVVEAFKFPITTDRNLVLKLVGMGILLGLLTGSDMGGGDVTPSAGLMIPSILLFGYLGVVAGEISKGSEEIPPIRLLSLSWYWKLLHTGGKVVLLVWALLMAAMPAMIPFALIGVATGTQDVIGDVLVYALSGITFVLLIYYILGAFVWAGRTDGYRETFTRESLKELARVGLTRRYAEAVAFFIILGSAGNVVEAVLGGIPILGGPITMVTTFYLALVFFSEAGRAYSDVIGDEVQIEENPQPDSDAAATD